MDKVSLRRARLTDAKPAEACLTAAYAKARADLSDLPDVTGGIADDIGENLVFVAESGGELAGVIVLIEQEGVMLVANLGVDPKHAGQGVAGRLLALAENEGRRTACREMQLRTHAELEDTRSMYLYLGWVEDGQTGSVIQMYKRL